MHAKLALPGELGRMTRMRSATSRTWTEFTRESRVRLMDGGSRAARRDGARFLLRLVAASERLAGADESAPQFLSVDYDDEAMREAMAEIESDEDAEDE